PAMLTSDDNIEDFIKGHDHMLKVAAKTRFSQAQAQREVGSCQGSGDGNGSAAERLDRSRLAGDDHGAGSVGHARAARAQDVLVSQVGVSMQAECRQFEFARKGPPVERFDIDKLMFKTVWSAVDLIFGESVEHEGIVRVRAVPDANELFFGNRG